MTTRMVKKLSLKVQKKVEPHEQAWVHDQDHLIVKDQYLISFSVGQWKGQIWCDVIPMITAHLLLGHPWLYDQKVKHNARCNTFEFIYEKCRKIQFQRKLKNYGRKTGFIAKDTEISSKDSNDKDVSPENFVKAFSGR